MEAEVVVEDNPDARPKVLGSANGCFVDGWLEELWLDESSPEAAGPAELCPEDSCPEDICSVDDVIEVGVTVKVEVGNTAEKVSLEEIWPAETCSDDEMDSVEVVRDDDPDGTLEDATEVICPEVMSEAEEEVEKIPDDVTEDASVDVPCADERLTKLCPEDGLTEAEVLIPAEVPGEGAREEVVQDGIVSTEVWPDEACLDKDSVDIATVEVNEEEVTSVVTTSEENDLDGDLEKVVSVALPVGKAEADDPEAGA